MMDPGQLPPFQLEDFKLDNEHTNDEESNNGPLDFSLHRVVGFPIPSEVLKDAARGRRRSLSESQRVKLTLRETPDQRERRLEKGRERMKRLRSNESFEERQIRLLKARECQERRRRRERELETSEEREKRLSVARERTRLRRSQESEEQREKRLRATRERLRLKRLTESPDERQRRLNTQRERKRYKYHYLASDDREVYRNRKPKVEADFEKRQTRGISFKYDIIDDELDEALLHLQSPDHHGNNSPDEIRWLTEPEVCLSVDSSQAFSPGKNADNDQTQQSSSYGANTGSIPPPQCIQEQLSEHVSNLVMSTSETAGTCGMKTTVEQLPDNQNCAQANMQQSNDLESDCCSSNVHPMPAARDQKPMQCNNNHHSEMGKPNNYTGSQVSQFSAMNSSSDPHIQYERNLSTYDNVTSAESSQMRLPLPHHQQEMCNQYPHHSQTNSHSPLTTNAPVYPNVTQSHNDTPLNLHHPHFAFARYPPSYLSSQKQGIVYPSYPNFHLPSSSTNKSKDESGN